VCKLNVAGFHEKFVISLFSSMKRKTYENPIFDTFSNFDRGLNISGVRILNDRQGETSITKLFKSLTGVRRGNTGFTGNSDV
jgi:hypothetical protein